MPTLAGTTPTGKPQSHRAQPRGGGRKDHDLGGACGRAGPAQVVGGHVGVGVAQDSAETAPGYGSVTLAVDAAA